MNPLIIPIFAIIFVFGVPVIAGIILGLKYMNNRHAERMGLIEQGIIPPQKEKRKGAPSRLASLRLGIVLPAVGLGMLVGYLLSRYLNVYSTEMILFIIISSQFIFGGIGWFIFFLISKNVYDNEEREDSDNNDLA